MNLPGMNDLQDQLLAAQARPRNMARVKENVAFSCQQPELADVALYEYLDSNGKRVTGPTITLARELLRCYGNGFTTMIELHREDNQSTMITYAWDIESNVWAHRQLVVPHVRTTDGADQPVTDVREITGLLNDVTARRQRRCILDILPSWLVAQAKNTVWKTLTAQDAETAFDDRRDELIARFAFWDITADQLATKLAMPIEAWSEISLARMRVLLNSLDLGALRADEEFPPGRLTATAINAAEVDPELAAAATPKQAPTEATAPEPGPAEATPPAETDKPRANTRATNKTQATKDKPTTETGG